MWPYHWLWVVLACILGPPIVAVVLAAMWIMVRYAVACMALGGLWLLQKRKDREDRR